MEQQKRHNQLLIDCLSAILDPLHPNRRSAEYALNEAATTDSELGLRLIEILVDNTLPHHLRHVRIPLLLLFPPSFPFLTVFSSFLRWC
jgi:hypothetical protein